MSGWWGTFFDAFYRRAWAPVLGDERTQPELEGLEKLLLEYPSGRILDVCGGDGRVARPLAACGHDLTVADYSRSMLDHGRSQVGAEALRWVRADARALPFEGSFDLALNLYTSFGFFDTDAEHLAMLSSIARSLRPGGYLLMDLVHRDFVLRAAPGRDWFELEDGSVVLRSFAFDPVSGRSVESIRLISEDDDVERSWSLRLFTASELRTMLWQAGFELEQLWSGYDLGTFSFDSERLLLLARRIGESARAGAWGRGELSLEAPSWRDLATDLRCPIDGKPLQEAGAGLLTRVLERFRSGECILPFSREPDSLLLTSDGTKAYAVLDGMPLLTAEDVIVFEGMEWLCRTERGSHEAQ
ncbi:MAG: class I SAM-dependent methyltransferase [Myxococcota bacterium]|jgi:SAM-dependent methyltransferase|nr:class I SAM-dependent methyltransferase [Myxococcota bacterium]